MKNEQMRARELEALQRLLDCCGADRTRWPAPERRRFAPLVAADAEARRMVAEAAALDSLIDMAPLVDAGRRSSLVDRIVAEALAVERAPAAAIVIPRTLRPNGSGGSFRTKLAMSGKPPRLDAGWPTAMLLAASLVLGIFAGTTGAVERVLAPFTVATGLQTVEGDPLRMALGDEGTSLGVEELL